MDDSPGSPDLVVPLFVPTRPQELGDIVFDFDFDVVIDVREYLDQFVRYAGLGLDVECKKMFDDYLATYLDMFPVFAEYASFLVSRSQFDPRYGTQLADLLQYARYTSFSSDQNELVILLHRICVCADLNNLEGETLAEGPCPVLRELLRSGGRSLETSDNPLQVQIFEICTVCLRCFPQIREAWDWRRVAVTHFQHFLRRDQLWDAAQSLIYLLHLEVESLRPIFGVDPGKVKLRNRLQLLDQWLWAWRDADTALFDTDQHLLHKTAHVLAVNAYAESTLMRDQLCWHNSSLVELHEIVAMCEHLELAGEHLTELLAFLPRPTGRLHELYLHNCANFSRAVLDHQEHAIMQGPGTTANADEIPGRRTSPRYPQNVREVDSRAIVARLEAVLQESPRDTPSDCVHQLQRLRIILQEVDAQPLLSNDFLVDRPPNRSRSATPSSETAKKAAHEQQRFVRLRNTRYE